MDPVNRRQFSTLLAGAAAGLVASASAADANEPAASSTSGKKNLSGIFFDPRLRGTSTLILSENAAGEVKIVGEYVKHGKVATFFGEGTFDGKHLKANYAHHSDPYGHGAGTLDLKPTEINGAFALAGEARSADGRWHANLTWFEVRA
jgi:hypothetical protein